MQGNIKQTALWKQKELKMVFSFITFRNLPALWLTCDFLFNFFPPQNAIENEQTFYIADYSVFYVYIELNKNILQFNSFQKMQRYSLN